ncbi:hypothetical protein FACS1894217_08940 [Clostridia bacterium]|nr:hypothetical protein FACS1894217_08940 [Clostridia bacterium]
MKLIEVARQQRDLLNEGIAWIAVWQQATKNGRHSWFAEDFFPDDSNEEEPIFSDEDKIRLSEIAALDADAVLLNGYLHSWIGSADETLNAADISLGIKRHYDMHNALVGSYLADEDFSPNRREDTELSNIAERDFITSRGYGSISQLHSVFIPASFAASSKPPIPAKSEP